MTDSAISHKLQMDSIYAFQRHIYDASRKHYLLGRDRLINDLAPPHDGRVLELGCGTGRNLIIAAKRHGNADFYGLDISHEMLKTAAKHIDKHLLADRISIQQGDATNFSPQDLFGIEKFDRIYISYSLSMIPDWQGTLEQAFRHLSEKGSIHIVDFGQQTELPKIFKSALTKWLKLFHVTPRADLFNHVSELAKIHNRNLEFRKLYKDYSHYCVIGPKRFSPLDTKKAA
jgi:S-adenosylmethionine-diacylgycerolhomoserine-N-methlytransferase